MIGIAREIILESARVGWTIFHQLTPTKSVDELAFLFENLRDKVVGDKIPRTREKLQEQITATREVLYKFKQAGVSSKSQRILKDRVATLEKVLQQSQTKRDVYSGSIFDLSEIGDEWKRIADQEELADFLVDRIKGLIAFFTVNRELFEDDVRLRTTMNVEKEMLQEIKRSAVSSSAAESYDRRLRSLDMALELLDGTYVETSKSGPKKSNRKPGGKQASKERTEIPIG